MNTSGTQSNQASMLGSAFNAACSLLPFGSNLRYKSSISYYLSLWVHGVIVN